MIIISAIESVMKKLNERDGEYQVYWIWWNQVFCNSIFQDSG